MAGMNDLITRAKRRLERHISYRVLTTVAEGYQKDKVMENAAAMTYFGVFSIFPTILIFMSVASIVLQNNETAEEQVLGMVTNFLPVGQDRLQTLIQDVIEARGVAAGVGSLTLIWSALGFFQVIDGNVNEIWGVSKPRSFVKSKLFALTMVGGLGAVALASFIATAAVEILAGITGKIPGSVVFWQLAVSLVSFFTIAAVFYLLYRYAPQREVAYREIWPAALLTAFLWEATRRLLSFYLQQADMVSGYGPIGAAMALLFWIYIASMIILVGAELSYAIAKERRNLPLWQQMKVVSPPGEQPTPKFAPQTGEGFRRPQDEKEPTVPEGRAA